MHSKYHGFIRAVFSVASVATAIAGYGNASAAEFSEAELYIELNDTDGDLGIHASIDGGPYTSLSIEDPGERTIFGLTSVGPLQRQGLTQLFWESAEPTFDELPPARFFTRFPEGLYEMEGVRGKTEFEAQVWLSHVLAAPPSNVLVGGLPAAGSCSAKDLPSVREPVYISWDAVTQSHPRIGKAGDVEIERYQLFVEQGNYKFAVDLPPHVTEFRIPSEILVNRGRFKFEIIARATNLNNTAIESCFNME